MYWWVFLLNSSRKLVFQHHTSWTSVSFNTVLVFLVLIFLGLCYHLYLHSMKMLYYRSWDYGSLSNTLLSFFEHVTSYYCLSDLSMTVPLDLLSTVLSPKFLQKETEPRLLALQELFSIFLGIFDTFMVPYQLNSTWWNWGAKPDLFWIAFATIWLDWGLFDSPESQNRKFADSFSFLRRKLKNIVVDPLNNSKRIGRNSTSL